MTSCPMTNPKGSSHASSPPIRIHLGKLLDVLLVSDPDQIRWLNQHERVQRPLDANASWLHRLIERRLGEDLAFSGRPLPVFAARENAERARAQRALFTRLEPLRGMPGEETDRMAEYVAGKLHLGEIGAIAQQWCGRLFMSHYRSAPEVHEAGRLLANWPTTSPLRAYLDRKQGRLSEAKKVISNVADDDLHCVHATSIGMENITRSLHKLRHAALLGIKRHVSPDEILRECLHAPPAVLRGCAGELSVPFLSQPLTKRTLIVFLVARSYRQSGDLDDAFLGGSWSACPAREVIPEMLRGVWHAAHDDQKTGDKTLLAKINNWGRRLRAVPS
jgi:hypothetical protein